MGLTQGLQLDHLPLANPRSENRFFLNVMDGIIFTKMVPGRTGEVEKLMSKLYFDIPVLP